MNASLYRCSSYIHTYLRMQFELMRKNTKFYTITSDIRYNVRIERERVVLSFMLMSSSHATLFRFHSEKFQHKIKDDIFMVTRTRTVARLYTITILYSLTGFFFSSNLFCPLKVTMSGIDKKNKIRKMIIWILNNIECQTNWTIDRYGKWNWQGDFVCFWK